MGQRGSAGPFLGALLLLLRAKGIGRGDGQGQRKRVRRGATDPPATGVRWAERGMRDEGQREGWRQRARPRTGRVTHGLSEGLKGGSGRDLHAGLLPSGYALPPEAMICNGGRKFTGRIIYHITERKAAQLMRGQEVQDAALRSN